MKRRTAATRRAGFTLIEVLIVIAIISVLASLLLVGLSAASKSAKRYKTTSEINQLEIACNNFKNDFKVYPPTPPGGFTIPTRVNKSDLNYQFLRRMFPHWIPHAPGSPPQPEVDNTNISATVDFNGVSLGGPLIGEGQTLDGNQALVYFLGGPPTDTPNGPIRTGWHPTKPYPATGTTAKGPYYEFPQARLKLFPGITQPWFVDPYDSPYAYFVSPTARTTGAANTLLQFPLSGMSGANSAAPPNATPPNGTVTNGWRSADDSVTTGTVVVPFFIAANKPQNPKGVQIISAGPDQRFGPGDLYTPGQGAYMADGNSPGGDDLGNFNGGTLSNEQ